MQICNKMSADQTYNKTGTDGVIYLDNQSTTQVDPRVLTKMMDVFTNDYGNPHSKNHAFGWKSEELVDEARIEIAKVINCDESEIIFTSGATESNNIAIKGVAHFYKTETKNHIVTVMTEHKCVIETCRNLQQEGFDITFLSPQKDGLVNLSELENAITDRTILVSIMAVNNEIGVIQDLIAIGNLCRKNGVFFHSDAAQAFGKIPLDMKKLNIDLMSISAHKIYGPKGVGALYVRKNPRVRLSPLISGGGQERGMRSGTTPTPLVAGFGEAAKICMQDFEKDKAHIEKLSKKLYDAIMQIPEVYLNGDYDHRYKGNLNFSFAFIEGESLMMAIKNIAVSSGSACTSDSLEPSYVLHSLGLGDELAHSAIRFGIGRFNTEEEIDIAIDVIKKAVIKLRDLSPLWEMFQEGIDISKVDWVAH